MTTKGRGLRASSRATLRPTRPAPQTMKWFDKWLISRSMRLLPKTDCSSNSSKAWVAPPKNSSTRPTPVTIMNVLKMRPMCDSGWTSPYPIVVMVVSTMYQPSNHGQPSMKWNPAMPINTRASSAAKMILRLKRAFTADILARRGGKRKKNALRVSGWASSLTSKCRLVAGGFDLLLFQALHPAVMPAVSEVNHQPYDQPHNQPGPVHPAQLVHHVAVEQDAHDRNEWYPRRAERAVLCGVLVPQNHDCDAHDDERQQRTDVHHLANVVDRSQAADDGRQQPNQHSVLVRGAELGMNGGEEAARQQAVISHRVEHASLPEQHDQHYAGQAGERAHGNEV